MVSILRLRSYGVTTTNWRFLTSYSKDLEQGNCLILAMSTRIRTFLKSHTVQLYLCLHESTFRPNENGESAHRNRKFLNRTPEWFRTLSTLIRVAKYPASKMLKFSFLLIFLIAILLRVLKEWLTTCLASAKVCRADAGVLNIPWMR